MSPVRYGLPTQCICVFRMVLTINSVCFPKQYSPVGICIGAVMCSCEISTGSYILHTSTPLTFSKPYIYKYICIWVISHVRLVKLNYVSFVSLGNVIYTHRLHLCFCLENLTIDFNTFFGLRPLKISLNRMKIRFHETVQPLVGTYYN
jgi:hypothetical protein